MAYPPEFVEELKQRAGIAELVGRRVALKKRGREHTGLCPFHNEKSPSFTVSEDKGFFHCFGCGAHGSVFDFVMRTEGLSFPEAVERLAAQAGMEVPRLSAADRVAADHNAELLRLMEDAAGWFETQLGAGVGRQAREYLNRRGLAPETIANFRLGYAPGRRDALKGAMLARKFTDAQLVEAGLVIRPEDGGDSYDRFRDRVMFPIADRRGRVIAFGGRALSAEAKAKYLNSPETPLFHKGRVLYNHANARPAAHAAQAAVLAEGYMDVIALAQAGFAHAVAPLGTAVTEDQLAALWRLAPEPVLCLDGDAAGWRAAQRAAERALPLLRPGYSLGFALMPEGSDPDDLIQSAGADAMREVLAGALPLAEVLWRMTRAAHAVDTPERRAAFRAALGQLADRIRDRRICEYYHEEFNDRLRSLLDRQRGARSGRPWRGPGGPGGPGRPGRPGGYRRAGSGPSGPAPAGLPPASRLKASLAGGRRDEKILTMVVFHPELIERFHESLAELHFAAPELDRLRSAILDTAAGRPGLDSANLRDHLTMAGHGEILERIAGAGAVEKYWFAQAGVELEKVAADLHQAMARGRRSELDEELRSRHLALAREMSPAEWKRFQAFQRGALAPGDGDEADAGRLRDILDGESSH